MKKSYSTRYEVNNKLLHDLYELTHFIEVPIWTKYITNNEFSISLMWGQRNKSCFSFFNKIFPAQKM